MVGHRHAPNFRIVLGRNGDLGMQLDVGVAPAKHGAVWRERHFVVIRLAAARMKRRRPEIPTLHIAHVAEASPVIQRGVFAPPRDGQIAPAAVAAARVGHHHAVRSVRQQVPTRRQRMRRHVPPHHHGQRSSGRLFDVVFLRRFVERHQMWTALLQQQFGGLHAWLGVKAPLHRVAVQAVVERDEAHGLVMRHVGLHHDAACSRVAETRGGVIDRFEQAPRPQRTFRREGVQIFRGLFRTNLRREHGRVGRHHQVVSQAALQSETRHAERAVLIIRPKVLEVVGRF